MNFIRRSVKFRVFSALAVTAAFSGRAGAQSVDIFSYHPIGSFALPTDPVGNPVAFSALPNGQVITLAENQISLQSAVGSGSFNAIGNLPAGFKPTYGPSFLAVSSGGIAAAGDQNGDIAVFNAASPTAVTSTSVSNAAIYNLGGGTFDYDAKWFNNNLLAISDAHGVDVLNTSNGKLTNVITDVGGASAGIAFDAHGNLYTGDGYSYSGTGTGSIKEFSESSWQSVLAGGSALDFQGQGISVAKLLSANSLGFDNSGNFYVGGADTLDVPGDYGYDALVSASAIQTAAASQQPVLISTDPSSASFYGPGYLNPISDPYGATGGDWSYNPALGDLYLTYPYSGDTNVYVYAVPEPASTALLAMAACTVLSRRFRKL
jgi:hypothetical protein